MQRKLQQAVSPLLFLALVLSLVASSWASVVAGRKSTITSGRGLFAAPLPGGRLPSSSSSSSTAAFQNPWLPRPMSRRQPQRPITKPTTTTTMSERTSGAGSGLLKNLQGLFKGTSIAGGGKQQKPVRLPTIQEVHQAMLAPEGAPTRLAQLMQTDLPEHPGLKKGVLPNGLRYAILRNAAPPGRFDAFLEIFAGSADELESQQGMAHIVEHISYMGSRKRERLFGTGSQTNAFTDFHHTVYFACCPVDTLNLLGRPRPMLPMALDALSEVLEARFEESRLEKERAAILSEMSMVNTMDYRVECQILSALHAENKLALRFPIGKEEVSGRDGRCG